MTRSPLRTRAPSSGEEKEKEKIRPTDALVTRLTRPIIPLGHSPCDDDEKKQVYTDIIRLKSAGKSNKECGEVLGVTSRTIDNYRADPYYTEIEQELETQAHGRGYQVIGELISDALAVMYTIMTQGKSEFVRFKAAETLLNYAGYSVPRETAVQHSRVEAEKFLEEVRSRQQIQVNVQVNQLSQGETPTETRVVVSEAGENVPLALAQYYEPVQHGGRLPASFQGQKEQPP